MRPNVPLEVSPRVAVNILPAWLAIEADYANQKYGEHNPQLAALQGGLADPLSMAYQEVSNYHGRFWHNYLLASGEEHLLVKASQALGKLLGANRALLRVCFERQYEVTRQVADDMTFDTIENALLGRITSVSETPLDEARRRANQARIIEPALEDINASLKDAAFGDASEKTLGLLVAQAQLWTDFTCVSGMIAMPGVDSTDPDGKLGIWRA